MLRIALTRRPRCRRFCPVSGRGGRMVWSTPPTGCAGAAGWTGRGRSPEDGARGRPMARNPRKTVPTAQAADGEHRQQSPKPPHPSVRPSLNPRRPPSRHHPPSAAGLDSRATATMRSRGHLQTFAAMPACDAAFAPGRIASMHCNKLHTIIVSHPMNS